MCKAHLDTHSLIARSQEGFRLHLATSNVASGLVDVADNAARRHVRAAPLFHMAFTAARHRCDVTDRVITVNSVGRRQRLAGRTDVDIPSTVEPELGPRERAIISLAHVPHRNVWDDAGIGDKRQEVASPVSRVGREPLSPAASVTL